MPNTNAAVRRRVQHSSAATFGYTTSAGAPVPASAAAKASATRARTSAGSAAPRSIQAGATLAGPSYDPRATPKLGMAGIPAATIHRVSALAPTMPCQTWNNWHVARRCAHAPTHSLATIIGRMGSTAWIDLQLNPSAITNAAETAMMATHFPWLTMTNAQVNTATGGQPWQGAPMVTHATALRQIYSYRQLFEMVVEMMSDQIYVAAFGKAESFYIGWDNEVVRRHALGTFSDYLYAALTNAGLMIYLDNWESSKDSPNENLGRELLELHTVGTGNYTETDVRQSALLLTGHGINWDTLAYEYHPDDHYVGPVKVMGFSHSNSSPGGGPQVLRAYATYLANHPGTAKRICTRIAHRFVSDTPSSTLINHLISVYKTSGTSIKAVVRAALTDTEFWTSTGSKWKRPAEYLSSAVAMQYPTYVPSAEPVTNPWASPGMIYWLLDSAKHAPRSYPAVDGYSDVAADWCTTNGLNNQWLMAEAMGAQWDTELKGQPWTTSQGIAVGQELYGLVRRLTVNLTGWLWADEHLLPIVAFLNAGTNTTPPPVGTKLNQDQINWFLSETIRMILASPYAMIR